MSNPQIDVDISSVRKIIAEIPGLLEIAPPDLRNVVSEHVFRFLEHRDELVSLTCEIVTAGSAREVRYAFEPSERLLHVMTALRTQDYDFVVLKHPISSPDIEVSALDGNESSLAPSVTSPKLTLKGCDFIAASFAPADEIYRDLPDCLRLR